MDQEDEDVSDSGAKPVLEGLQTWQLLEVVRYF